MRTICVIQARLGGGTRFTPGQPKILADLCGKPVLAHVVERAKAIRGVDAVVVACPSGDQEEIARAVIGTLVCGPDVPENDVLGRYAWMARQGPADYVIRVTADCPFLAPDLAERALAAVRDGAVYACSRHDGGASDWPDGLDVEAFAAKALSNAASNATTPKDREDVTPYIRRNWPVVDIFCPIRWPAGVKLSIDTPTDMDYARQVMARIQLGPDGAGSRWTWLAVQGIAP